jgi:hypothetical protein
MRNLEDFCLDVFIYKYPGALHLCTPGQTFIYKYHGAPHLCVPYQTYIYNYDGSPHLIGLFDTIEQQIICEDFWFIQSSRAAKYL